MKPRTFLVGVTQPDEQGLREYLAYTGQEFFMEEFLAYQQEHGDPENGIMDPLGLVSFYAKLCYKSLVEGKNANVSRIRSIEDNIKATIKSGHGSVFEHVWINFVTTGCSRVFTHELVRHRVGTAFSQTSGRYVSIDKIDLVLPPELESDDEFDCPYCSQKKHNEELAVHRDTCPVCRCGINEPGYVGRLSVREFVDGMRDGLEQGLKCLRSMLIHDVTCEMCGGDKTVTGMGNATVECSYCKGTGKQPMPFADKKRITSAIRRLAPNGQDNEIGWSVNVRTLRHLLELRTSLAAEWEIRQVFNQVADIVAARWPLMMHGVTHGESADGVTELKGLRI